MANIDLLKIEIDTDPLARGYSGMTDKQLSDSGNAVDRTRIKSSMSGDELFQQTDETEFGILSDTQRQMWVSFCARDNIDPSASANVAFVQFIFGSGATLTALNSARNELISRFTELGIGAAGPGHVAEARK